jgi:dimethylhistidine N-methyltransferase
MRALTRRSFAAPGEDFAPGSLAAEVVAGLSAAPKRLPPKLFYDRAGSELFERITELPEYYLTRCEVAILRERARELAAMIPPRAALVEFGSGPSRKTRLLLGAARDPAAYVPVDIAAEFLGRQVDSLAREYPTVAMLPVVADFSAAFALPEAVAGLPRAGLFLGSTIGNLEPQDARAFLRRAGRILGSASGDGALFVIGVDLVKDDDTLNRAYNDAAGVTAAFNRNVLARINRELGAGIDVASFEHRAFFNRAASRIEMHLASIRDQRITVCGVPVEFAAGETILTEHSYKYDVEGFQRLARGAGWSPRAVWTDARSRFSVHVLGLAHDAEPQPARLP